MFKNKLKPFTLIILTFVFICYGKHFVVLFDDGFTYSLVPNCEVTIKGEDGEILHYGYTNVHGRIYARNLHKGNYSVTLRIFNKTYEYDIQIKDLEGTDTLFIPVR